jgi:hypothetical protein
LPNKTLDALCSASRALRIGLGSFTGCGKSAFSPKLSVALKLIADSRVLQMNLPLNPSDGYGG